MANNRFDVVQGSHHIKLFLIRLQESVSFYSSLGSSSCSNNSLSINGVGNITGSKDTFKTCLCCVTFHLNEPLLIKIKDTFEQVRIRFVSNGKEETMNS